MKNVLFQPQPSKLYILDKELGVYKLTIIRNALPTEIAAISDYLQNIYTLDSKVLIRRYYSFLCLGMLFEISIMHKDNERSLVLTEIPRKNWSEDRDELEDKLHAKNKKQVCDLMLVYSDYLPKNIVAEVMKLAKENS